MGVNFAFFQGADQEAIASGSLNLCKLACDLFSDGERVQSQAPFSLFWFEVFYQKDEFTSSVPAFDTA